MFRSFRLTSAAVVAALVAPAALLAAPSVGAPAPAFSAKNADGKTVSLADYKGKVVVLEWFNPGCPFVKKFYGPGKMQELQTKYVAKDVVWLTVSSNAAKNPDHLDGAALKKKAAELKSGSSELIDDTSGDLARLYAAKTTPHVFVIGKDGKLAYQGAIDSVATPNSADIAKATPYLANAIDASLAGKAASPAETKAYGCGVKL